jgi:hypothetical protein
MGGTLSKYPLNIHLDHLEAKGRGAIAVRSMIPPMCGTGEDCDRDLRVPYLCASEPHRLFMHDMDVLLTTRAYSSDSSSSTMM